MPEVGDTVFLTFPSADEKDAHAASSLRQSSTGRTGNPAIKYLRTTYGKEVKLEEKEVLITAVDDTTYIQINQDTGIKIFTDKPIQIISEDTLDITSKDDMTIATEGNLSISTDKNLTVTAKESIEMKCSDGGENVIAIDPGSGIAATTTQELNMKSFNDTNIESQTKMALKSGDDMMLSSDKKLIESGKKAVVINNIANVIAMEPITGISVASAMKLNMASVGNAMLASSKGLSLNALMDLKSSAGKKIVNSGKSAVEVNSGGSSVKLKATGIDLKGPTIKEN
jgi:uncharacterized protein (DUF2345 family)